MEKKSKREKILENLYTMRSLATEIFVDLQDENSEGQQFDYVNSPRLSDNFDSLNSTIKKIEKIIYQES